MFFVNLRDATNVERYGMLTLAAHEDIPGHHFASVAQQSLTNMPEEAKVRLEDKFHIARFHQAVLGGGNLPLRLLSE